MCAETSASEISKAPMTTCSVNQFEFSLIPPKMMHAQSGELLLVTRKLKQSPAVWGVITIGEGDKRCSQRLSSSKCINAIWYMKDSTWRC